MPIFRWRAGSRGAYSLANRSAIAARLLALATSRSWIPFFAQGEVSKIGGVGGGSGGGVGGGAKIEGGDGEGGSTVVEGSVPRRGGARAAMVEAGKTAGDSGAGGSHREPERHQLHSEAPRVARVVSFAVVP